MRFNFLIPLLAISFIIISTPFNQGICKNYSTDNYEIEMAEIGKPGTLVVKVWCFAKKPQISDDTFKKNAILGVLFKGVNDSGRIKGRKPLISQQDYNRDYINNFISNEIYKEYVSIAMNGYIEQNSLVKVGKMYKVGKICIISYNKLRLQLENDNIIKGLNSGF